MQFHVLIISAALIGAVNCQSADDLANLVFFSNGIASAPSEETSDDAITCAESCVPFYLCKNNEGTANALQFNEKNGCDNFMSVCCSANDVINIEELRNPEPEASKQQCGVWNYDGVGFSVADNTEKSKYGEFPWMVAVFHWEIVDDLSIAVYKCGGALIHPSVVITAAHCLATFTSDTILIRAGEWDLGSTDELHPHQQRNVSEVRIHPDFFPRALYNNVALLFLDEPVTLGPTVNIVCLPEEEDTFDDDNCFVSGWGKNLFGGKGKYQDILKKVNVNVVPEATCENSLRNTRLGPTFELHESFICAGSENGKDTCKGDGGSPMVCPSKEDPSRYKQAGIVSWGIDCGISNSPGVFANVALFREWIDEEMSYKDLDSNLYQA